MTGWTIAGIAILAVAAATAFTSFFNTWRRYHGLRVITCPDNLHPAAVRVDAGRAARWAAISGEPPVRLRSCSRWPEKEGCAQDCLAQIEASPEACLVQSIVASWYAGKRCFYCRKHIEDIAWHERPPAVLTPEGGTREWKEIAAQELPEVFKTHQPVCWPCHIRESFRREHQELVVERVHQVEAHHVIAPTVTVY